MGVADELETIMEDAESRNAGSKAWKHPMNDEPLETAFDVGFWSVDTGATDEDVRSGLVEEFNDGLAHRDSREHFRSRIREFANSPWPREPAELPKLFSWRQLIARVTDEPVLESVGEIDTPFDMDTLGARFHAWTETWVFFDIIDNLDPNVGCVPRYPPSGANEPAKPWDAAMSKYMEDELAEQQ
jgi:hypothetical protein